MVRDNAQTIANHLKDRGVIRIALTRGRLDQSSSNRSSVLS
jgi:hypothetical protein